MTKLRLEFDSQSTALTKRVVLFFKKHIYKVRNLCYFKRYVNEECM